MQPLAHLCNKTAYLLPSLLIFWAKTNFIYISPHRFMINTSHDLLALFGLSRSRSQSTNISGVIQSQDPAKTPNSAPGSASVPSARAALVVLKPVNRNDCVAAGLHHIAKWACVCVCVSVTVCGDFLATDIEGKHIIHSNLVSAALVINGVSAVPNCQPWRSQIYIDRWWAIVFHSREFVSNFYYDNHILCLVADTTMFCTKCNNMPLFCLLNTAFPGGVYMAFPA